MKAPTNLHGYTIERSVGKGGMGSVYVARKLSTHKQFAVKFLKEEFLEDATYLARFEREVAALRAIRHPNVVNVFEWSMPKGDGEAKPYVVMELLDGEGLDRLLRRQPVLPPQTAVAIMLQLLDGLAAAHAIGVIHRDLGPSNIFLTTEPDGGYLVRILDFGLARPIAAEDEVQVTQVGTLMGKPGYIAPETFYHKPLDARADLFACGMILFRMLAGRLPYKEREAQLLWAERYAERLHDREHPDIREFAKWVPEKLALACAKATRRKPEDRYQTAEDMQVELLDVDDSSLCRAAEATPTVAPVVPSLEVEDSSRPDSLSSSPARQRKRRLAIGGAVAAAVVVGGLILGWVLARSGGGVTGGEASAAMSSSPSTPSAPDGGSGEPPLVALATSPRDATSGTPVTGGGDAATADQARPGDPVVQDVAAPDGSATSSTSDASSPDTATPSVRLTLAGLPPGAVARVSGQVVGPESFIVVPWSMEAVEVAVEDPAGGFRPFLTKVIPNQDRTIRPTLRRADASTRDGGIRDGRRARDSGTATIQGTSGGVFVTTYE
jgi:serine/threonine protein kinase